MQVIKQVIMGSGDTQTIKMVVRDSERGATGPQGIPGNAATVTAGNAYTVEPGQAPAVMNTGTSSAAVFDFYIPKGEKGEQGERGAPGVNGINGRDGADGKDGVVQYTAGTGITIENNTIAADATSWGDIQGTMSNQTDLANALQGINNSIGALGDYSTNETNTGAKWIDGKTIYKKTVNTGALPSNTSKSVSHGIGESWDRILKAEGYSYASMYGLNVMIPNSGIDIQVADADIEITTTADYTGYSESYITLYYTKTS